MRVPANPPQTHQSPNPKPVTSNTTGRNIGFHSPTNNPNNLCYEPTSVLDLRRSPSPVTEKPASATEIVSRTEDPVLEWDEQVLHSLDWDSIIRDIDLHEDPVGPALRSILQSNICDPQVINLPELPHSQSFDPTQFVHTDFNICDINYPTQILAPDHHNLNSFDLTHDFHHIGLNGFETVEELLRAVDCFDSNQLQLAQAILERLNQRLRSPVGKPLQRAAFYFKEAFQTLLTGSNRSPRLSSWSDIVQNIKTYKAFSGISPIPLFSHFTTNQALLEALHGSTFLHVVDFDIGLGGQYASFMKEIAERAESCKATPVLLRVTAIVPEEYAVESRLIKENLSQFAQELKIRLQVDLVPFRTFEMLSFKAIKFMDGEKTAFLLSPTIFRRLGSTNNITAFLSDLRSVSPNVVVLVDNEGWTETGTASFRRNFVNSLEFYSLMLESLDAAIGGGGGGDWVRRIEMVLMKPRILAAVEAAGRRVAPWKDVFYGAGMKPVQLSQFADFQAECLLGKVQVRGFHVGKRQAELVLCWRDRPMVSTSAWRC